MFKEDIDIIGIFQEYSQPILTISHSKRCLENSLVQENEFEVKEALDVLLKDKNDLLVLYRNSEPSVENKYKLCLESESTLDEILEKFAVVAPHNQFFSIKSNTNDRSKSPCNFQH